jgi:hypothetical protein
MCVGHDCFLLGLLSASFWSICIHFVECNFCRSIAGESLSQCMLMSRSFLLPFVLAHSYGQEINSYNLLA